MGEESEKKKKGYTLLITYIYIVNFIYIMIHFAVHLKLAPHCHAHSNRIFNNYFLGWDKALYPSEINLSNSQ